MNYVHYTYRIGTVIHQHFKTIHSTQDYIRENDFENASQVLISCDEQTHGHGQYDRSWDHYSGNLAFSFLCDVNEVPTLTSLEMGVLLCQYFQEKHQTSLKLKWPNDILNTQGQKVAGILIHNKNDLMAVGIGINLFSRDFNDYPTKASSIFHEAFDYTAESMAKDIYQFILSRRLFPADIRRLWNKNCFHLNKLVGIGEQEGIFKGIGESGEAKVEINGQVKDFYSGSLSQLKKK